MGSRARGRLLGGWVIAIAAAAVASCTSIDPADDPSVDGSAPDGLDATSAEGGRSSEAALDGGSSVDVTSDGGSIVDATDDGRSNPDPDAAFDATSDVTVDATDGAVADSVARVSRSTPQKIAGLQDVVQIATAGNSCARLVNGKMMCWGYNRYGMVGDGTIIDRDMPTPVSGVTDAAGITTGDNLTCVLHLGGQVSCWDENRQGSVGDGVQFHRSCYGLECSPNPVDVVGVGDATLVAAGSGTANVSGTNLREVLVARFRGSSTWGAWRLAGMNQTMSLPRALEQ